MSNNKQTSVEQKIVYTDKYVLVLSEEEIKDVRPHKGKYHLEKGLIINRFPNYLTDLGECKLIIAHRPLMDATILDGVPLFNNETFNNDAKK